MRKHNNLFNMILAALFLALAYAMPFLTGQIPEIGAMLCPLHIPVLLCGFFCGWPWGLAVGFLAPIFRSLIFGMPPMFPTAVCMAFELATYGFIAGLLYSKLPRNRGSVYVSLISAMVIGRVVWGLMMMLCMGIKGSAFGISAFIAGAVTGAIPGIILQLVLIPVLVISLQKVNK
jgi:thiamine transporter ThiT